MPEAPEIERLKAENASLREQIENWRLSFNMKSEDFAAETRRSSEQWERAGRAEKALHDLQLQFPSAEERQAWAAFRAENASLRDDLQTMHGRAAHLHCKYIECDVAADGRELLRLQSANASLREELEEARNEACVRCGFPTHDIISAAVAENVSLLESLRAAEKQRDEARQVIRIASEQCRLHCAAAEKRSTDLMGALREAREALRESFLLIARQNPLSLPEVKQIDRASARIDTLLAALHDEERSATPRQEEKDLGAPPAQAAPLLERRRVHKLEIALRWLIDEIGSHCVNCDKRIEEVNVPEDCASFHYAVQQAVRFLGDEPKASASKTPPEAVSVATAAQGEEK